jgi:hypothetical protein
VYPQRAFPYDDLVATNKKRTRHDFGYELLDTGIFDGDRYFDVFVEYAKESPQDILIKISVWNRGPEPALLHERRNELLLAIIDKFLHRHLSDFTRGLTP